MNSYFQQIQLRASTFEEILSDGFQDLPGQKEHSNLAASRLAAWCRSTASGDWNLFGKRLKRDQLDIEAVLRRFSTVKHISHETPQWLADALWVLENLERPATHETLQKWRQNNTQRPFQDLFINCIEHAAKEATSQPSSNPSNFFLRKALPVFKQYYLSK